MSARVILWIIGAVAAVLYLRVGYFAFGTLAPHLECRIGPETRFWGYGIDVFARCFDTVPDAIITNYASILMGADRMLAIALTSFLLLWSIRSRVWVAAAASLAYGLSDWIENGFLVLALAGDTSAIAWASVLTVSKFACLSLALGAHIRAARHKRSN